MQIQKDVLTVRFFYLNPLFKGPKVKKVTVWLFYKKKYK